MTLEKFIAILFMFGVSIGTTVAVNIYGWGLHPQSWWWIIGAGFFWNICLHLIFRKLTT